MKMPRISTVVIAMSWFVLVFVVTQAIRSGCRKSEGARARSTHMHNVVRSVSMPLPARFMSAEPDHTMAAPSPVAVQKEIDPIEALRKILPDELRPFAEDIQNLYRVKHATIAAEERASHEVFQIPRTDSERAAAAEIAGVVLEAEDDAYDIAVKKLKFRLGTEGYRMFEEFNVTCDQVLNAMFQCSGLGPADVKEFAKMAKSDIPREEKYVRARTMLGTNWSRFGAHASLHLR